MNKPVTKLHLNESKGGTNHKFRVFFNPDKNREHFEVGMMFTVTSVNRHTGEITFGLSYFDCLWRDSDVPPEEDA